MRKALVALLILATNAKIGWAQESGQFGAGVILGEPIGGTVKYWLDHTQALDFGIGAGDEDSAVLYGDYLWHGWDIFPQPREGRLGLYLGFGPRIELQEREEDEFAIRGIGGADFWIPRHPIELFLEGGPVFQVTPGTTVDADIGLGVRFYLGGPSRARR